MHLKTHHVAFSVRDLKESIEWYKDKLGFKTLYSNSKGEPSFALLQSGDVKIELFDFGEHTKPLPDSRKDVMDDLHVVGTKHLCIEVENLEGKIEELKNKNIEFSTQIDTAGFGGKYIFIKDCNGILIELYQQ